MTTTTIAAWLLTYLLHSTIILGAVLALSHVMDGRGLALQETMFRTALIGGIVTAILQLGLGVAPAAGVFALEPAAQQSVAATASVPVATSVEALDAAIPGTGHDRDPAWATPFVVFWGIASIIALTVIVRSILDLRRLLQTRCFQPAGRLVERLAATMGLRQRVRISTSKAIVVPFATGIGRPEICCPERVNELAREHQTGLFAHEMAHLVRCDPAWQLAYRLGEALLVLQPLNRIVRRRLEEIAEHLTDERAAACTGDRLGLARCLVVVAHWGHSDRLGLPATAFAAGPRLDRRVRRLISGTTDRHVSTLWTLAIGIACVFGSVVILPAVASNTAHADQSTPSVRSVESVSSDETVEVSRVSGTTTWSTAKDRPRTTPPAAAVPEDRPSSAEPPTPPSPATAPTAPEAPPAPENLPAPEIAPNAPQVNPTPATPAPQVPPAPAASPAPVAEPVPSGAPTPVTPSARQRTSEVERRREEAHRRATERAQVRTIQSERARAAAVARQRYEISRVHVERARELAREAAGQARLKQNEATDIQFQVQQLQDKAEQLAREAARAERDRERAVREEARARAREATISFQEMTAEQREALQRRALEMRTRTEFRNQENLKAVQKRAQELADEARALAERAEAERRGQENEEK